MLANFSYFPYTHLLCLTFSDLMFRSMTAYSRFSLPADFGTLTFEIQSVNKKHLDIHCSLPPSFLSWEEKIKKNIEKKIFRGQISIKLFFSSKEKSATKAIPNLPLARQLKEGWEQIAREIMPDQLSSSFSLELLRDVPDLFTFVEEGELAEIYSEKMEEALTHALDLLHLRKVAEGELLYKDIMERVTLLKTYVDEIEKNCDAAYSRYKNQLISRLNEQLPHRFQPDNDEQILKAICLFAEKVDITEELTRFNAHISHFTKLAATSLPPIGKTLDFLVQELNREANTIAAKACDAAISQLVVSIKSELERIREQLQNIE